MDVEGAAAVRYLVYRDDQLSVTVGAHVDKESADEEALYDYIFNAGSYIGVPADQVLVEGYLRSDEFRPPAGFGGFTFPIASCDDLQKAKEVYRRRFFSVVQLLENDASVWGKVHEVHKDFFLLDHDFLRAALIRAPELYKAFDEEIDDHGHECALDVIEENPRLIHYMYDEDRASGDFMIQALHRNFDVYFFLTPRMRNDADFIGRAIEQIAGLQEYLVSQREPQVGDKRYQYPMTGRLAKRARSSVVEK